MAVLKLVNGEVSVSGLPETSAALAERPRVKDWLQRFTVSVLVPAAENPESGVWRFPNKAAAMHLAERFGKKLEEHVRRLDAWEDLKALFKLFTLLIIPFDDVQLAEALSLSVPMIYGAFARKDGRMLAGVAAGKPVYRRVVVLDEVTPENAGHFEEAFNRIAELKVNTGTPEVSAFFYNWLFRHFTSCLLAMAWPLFDEHTLDVFPERFRGASLAVVPRSASDTAETMRDALARRRYVLPPTGVTVIPPENAAGVERLVVWERGSWVVGRLWHANDTASLVLACPSIPVSISIWSMLAIKDKPVADDPLAALVADAYRDLVTVSEAKLARRSRRTEGEAREARRSERKGTQSYWYVPRILKEEGEESSEELKETARKEGRLRSLIPRRVAPHAVSGHLRRLTGTRKAASEAAKEAARRLGLQVPEGYTFVRPYVTGQAGKEKQQGQEKPARPVAKRRAQQPTGTAF
jgi:hypothetical protein